MTISICESLLLVLRILGEISSLIEANHDDRFDNDSCEADGQQDNREYKADVFVYFFIHNVLDVDSCSEHEHHLGTIYYCQDGVPKDGSQLLLEPSSAFICSYTSLVTPSMPAL